MGAATPGAAAHSAGVTWPTLSSHSATRISSDFCSSAISPPPRGRTRPAPGPPNLFLPRATRQADRDAPSDDGHRVRARPARARSRFRPLGPPHFIPYSDGMAAVDPRRASLEPDIKDSILDTVADT